MNDATSIRDVLSATIHENFNACRGRNGVSPDLLADLILASPVIRRIQAEAIRRASREFEFWLNAGGPTPGTAFLDRLADQIEKGSSDV